MKLRKTELYLGIIAACMIGAYFMFIQLANLAHISFLRAGNAILMYIAINEAIRHNVVKRRNGYSTKLLSGIKTGSIAVVLSVVGLILFLKFGGDNSSLIESSIFPAQNITQFVAAIVIEGLSSVVVLSFVSLQYWKNFRFSSFKGFYLTKDSI